LLSFDIGIAKIGRQISAEPAPPIITDADTFASESSRLGDDDTIPGQPRRTGLPTLLLKEDFFVFTLKIC